MGLSNPLKMFWLVKSVSDMKIYMDWGRVKDGVEVGCMSVHLERVWFMAGV